MDDLVSQIGKHYIIGQITQRKMRGDERVDDRVNDGADDWADDRG